VPARQATGRAGCHRTAGQSPAEVQEADSREDQRTAGELRRGECLAEHGEGDEPGHDRLERGRDAHVGRADSRVPNTVTIPTPSHTQAGWEPRRSHQGGAMGSQKSAPVTKA
jgi:hypothetical protein